MALQSSGAITLLQIAGEFGGSKPHSLSEYYRGGLTTSNNTGVPTSGAISLSNFYGTTAVYTLTSSGDINSQKQRKQIKASDFISAGGIMVIPSDIWVWSDSTSVAALKIDIACTINNYGKIIGKGGNGGNKDNFYGGAGGRAVEITASGVTINNYSGAYIAGGGGGGGAAGGAGNPGGTAAGGGGGAGGGSGGYGWRYSNTAGGGGGGLNRSGADAYGVHSWNGFGGGAGGSGAYAGVSSSDNTYGSYGGGGGGRILPGVGGENNAAGTARVDGRGGSAGGAGDSGSTGGNGGHAGGGGGWGAKGGNSDRAGGAGGAAIYKGNKTYSLTNSGTIYGTTG
jgi:hypothetical protein